MEGARLVVATSVVETVDDSGSGSNVDGNCELSVVPKLVVLACVVMAAVCVAVKDSVAMVVVVVLDATAEEERRDEVDDTVDNDIEEEVVNATVVVEGGVDVGIAPVEVGGGTHANPLNGRIRSPTHSTTTHPPLLANGVWHLRSAILRIRKQALGHGSIRAWRAE